MSNSIQYIHSSQIDVYDKHVGVVIAREKEEMHIQIKGTELN